MSVSRQGPAFLKKHLSFKPRHQGLSLLGGMQGSWCFASTAHVLSQPFWAELLGAAGRQDAGVWLRGICWEEGLNISSALIPGGPSP